MKKVTKPSDLFSGAKLRVCRCGDSPPHWFNDTEYLLHTKGTNGDYVWSFTTKYMRDPDQGRFGLAEYAWTFTYDNTINSPILGVFNGSSYDYYVVNPKDTEIFIDKEYESLWI